MKLNDLTEDQLKIVADNRPEFITNYNPELPEEIKELLK